MAKRIAEIEKIHDAEFNIHAMREKWLRSRGWKSTCQTPGSFWMWEKEWEGKKCLVDTDTAVRIQEFWDMEEDLKLHPDFDD